MTERNVLGEPLESCGTTPLTGFYRDGCCSTGPEDLGSHTICAVVTAEFLEHQRSIGNDLTTPRREFGFPVVTHPRVDGTLWVFPLESSYRRFPPTRACRVWRSTDCGASWTEQGKGLPDEGFFAGVMRDAMCVDDGDPAGVYIGSRDGSVYASPDEGESWVAVAEHLPDVLCLRAATV